MSGASGPPVAEAAALFRRLGYTVTDEGREFVAHQKWRTVAVRVLGAEESVTPAVADGGRSDDAPDLRCYVTSQGAAALGRRIAAFDPDPEWAVVGLDDDGHDVVRAP